MGLFSGTKEPSGDAVGVALMLGELRDLRGTIDKHDERLRGEIGGVKQSVSDLSQAVLRSQGDVGAIRTDVDRMSDHFESLKEDVHGVKADVHDLKSARDLENAGWNGPQKVAKRLILIASTLTALVVIVRYWTPIVAILTP